MVLLGKRNHVKPVERVDTLATACERVDTLVRARMSLNCWQLLQDVCHIQPVNFVIVSLRFGNIGWNFDTVSVESRDTFAQNTDFTKFSSKLGIDIKSLPAKGKKKLNIKKIPLVARPCKEDSRKNK